MTPEVKEIINMFEVCITLCCPERKPATICFDCRHTQDMIDMIKLRFKCLSV